MFSDNHVHTPFCPHGTNEKMEDYIKTAIEKGLKQLTFTEHAPLPITDPTPEQNSSIKEEDVELYLNKAKELKERYKHDITIHIGFEIDYIEGYEEQTLAFLKAYPDTIAHSILSVHFLKLAEDNYYCIDYDKDDFIGKLKEVSYARLSKSYEETLHKALSLPFGEWTPRTIGHLTLIYKFKKAHEETDSINWTSVLNRAKENDYTLDYNFAGLDKPYYQDVYPSESIVLEAMALGIPLSYGSDAHHPSEVGRYFERGISHG